MAYYKLVSHNRPDSHVDEVIFNGDDGVRRTVSIDVPSELSDSEAETVRGLGYEVVEVESPAESDVPQQPVGGDVAGMSPVISQAAGEPALSQIGQAAAVHQSSESSYDDDDETHDAS